MVTFELLAYMSKGVLNIRVDHNYVGNIIKGRGFAIYGNFPREGTLISSDDLREIAKKTDEVIKFGCNPLKCITCGNTPYFPSHDFANDDLEYVRPIYCPNDIHREYYSHKKQLH